MHNFTHEMLHDSPVAERIQFLWKVGWMVIVPWLSNSWSTRSTRKGRPRRLDSWKVIFLGNNRFYVVHVSSDLDRFEMASQGVKFDIIVWLPWVSPHSVPSLRVWKESRHEESPRVLWLQPPSSQASWGTEMGRGSFNWTEAILRGGGEHTITHIIMLSDCMVQSVLPIHCVRIKM